jgi:hypothetical protein
MMSGTVAVAQRQADCAEGGFGEATGTFQFDDQHEEKLASNSHIRAADDATKGIQHGSTANPSLARGASDRPHNEGCCDGAVHQATCLESVRLRRL